MNALFERTASRRRFLAGLAGGAAALSLRPTVGASAAYLPIDDTSSAPAAARWRGPLPTKHLAWVWQFNTDGEPERIREVLAARGLGVSLKTHDGLNWMSR